MSDIHLCAKHQPSISIYAECNCKICNLEKANKQFAAENVRLKDADKMIETIIKASGFNNKEHGNDLVNHIERIWRDCNNWKANHDNQVKIKAAVLDRPDLGDRATKVTKLVAELEHLKQFRLCKDHYNDPHHKAMDSQLCVICMQNKIEHMQETWYSPAEQDQFVNETVDAVVKGLEARGIKQAEVDQTRRLRGFLQKAIDRLKADGSYSKTCTCDMCNLIRDLEVQAKDPESLTVQGKLV